MSSLRDRVGLSGLDTGLPGMTARRTIRAAISCVGHGLHSGLPVTMTLRPAAPGTGIVFRRTDRNVDIAAKFDNVVDTRLCTVIASGDVRIGTIEHLMAALAANRIDDVVVETGAPELPILDGSAAPFNFLIQSAGIRDQAGLHETVEILRHVRVEDKNAYAELQPNRAGEYGFDLSLSIDFAAAAIGMQSLQFSLTPERFNSDLAAARTFTLASEVAALRQAGLAKGGSLDNAIVVDGDKILNPAGLRFADEFVRHKMLDVVGDLALAGAAIQGRFIGHCTGHRLNNLLLRALFADAANYRLSRGFERTGLQLSAA
jgi:UDP-3-O-[3-hydroxymyristoyl] N-acetylglucosamine deacetylase